MKDELSELEERIYNLSDRDLLKVARGNRFDYPKEAVYYATEELTRRGIPLDSPDRRAFIIPLTSSMLFSRDRWESN
jgi:hypothetical protein